MSAARVSDPGRASSASKRPLPTDVEALLRKVETCAELAGEVESTGVYEVPTSAQIEAASRTTTPDR